MRPGSQSGVAETEADANPIPAVPQEGITEEENADKDAPAQEPEAGEEGRDRE